MRKGSVKRFFCFILCFVMAFSVYSCDKNGESDNGSRGNAENESITENGQDNGIPEIYIEAYDITKEEYKDASILIVGKRRNENDLRFDGVKIKIRGNSTSSGEKKPYNIKFSKKVPLLGMGSGKKWCLLANLFDKTLMRNKLFYDFARDIGMAYVSECEYADVYLNGKYMGNYLVCEPAEAGSTRIDIDENGNEFVFEFEPYENYSNPVNFRTPIYNILFGFRDPEYPTDAQKDFVKDFFRKAEYALAALDEKAVSEYFDIGSFVDSYIVNELFKNVDYQTSSTRFYIKNGKLFAGPVWDFDLSAGNTDHSYYKDYHNSQDESRPYASCEGDYCKGIWNGEFLKTDWFLEKAKKRYEEITPFIENLFSDNEKGKNRIDSLVEKYGDSFDRNYGGKMWNITKKYSPYERVPFGSYEENVEFLRNWLIKRHAWFLKKFGIK